MTPTLYPSEPLEDLAHGSELEITSGRGDPYMLHPDEVAAGTYWPTIGIFGSSKNLVKGAFVLQNSNTYHHFKTSDCYIQQVLLYIFSCIVFIGLF